MRVLVTGSQGFIGQAVCAEITKRAMIAVGFDTALGFDIRNGNTVKQAAQGCKAIINLAGMLGTSEIFGSEKRAAQINIEGAIHVMDVALEADIPLVQIATGHEGQLNPYAITKKCATDLALARARYLNQKISIVRAYHVYGPGQKMCAPHGTSKVRKIIPSFVARALTGMPIEINGDGNQCVDLVYIEDVAKVLVDALFTGYGEVMEAGTGVATKVIDVARQVADLCKSYSPIAHLPMRNGEPEGAHVIAQAPQCPNAWPYRMEDTMAWYRDALTGKKRGVG